MASYLDQEQVTIGGGTQNVNVVSSVLPTGAATETTSAAILADTADMEVSLASIDAKLTNPLPVSGSVSVSNFPATQPVSGTVTANQGTAGASPWPIKIDQSGTNNDVDVISSALPTGASTSALQTSGNASLTSIDSKLTSPLTITGTVTANLGTIDGAATAANQTTANTSLSSIDSKTPSLGQATMAASSPVVIASNQSAVPVSGTVTANIGTTNGLALDATLTGGSQKTKIVDAGGVNVATVSALGAVKVDGSAVTQPISAASLPLPTGASTSALQTTGNTSLASIDAKLTNPLPVSGTVTANAGTGNFTVVQPTGTNLHTVVDNFPATQPVSGTVTVTQATGTNLHAVIDSGTVTVSGTVTANLGTIDGASTAANQTTANTSLASIDSKTPALGQATMANSSPVVIASNQSAIPVTGTFFQATQPISGSVSVSNFPADTDALAQASTTSGQLGNLAMGAVTTAAPTYTTAQTDPLSLTTAGALRVDGSAVTQPVSAVSLPLPTGAATSANQTTANASLASIDTKLTSPLTVTGSFTATPVDGIKATYSASASAITPALLATDVFTITGSATKTIRITKMYIDGTSTGGVNGRVLVIKRSTADTAGTSTTLTNVPHESTQAAATVTVLAYTANPTLGTTVGTMRAREIAFPTAGTQLSTDGTMYEAIRPSKAIVLRGAAEQIALNLNGVTIAGGSLNFNIEWTEE